MSLKIKRGRTTNITTGVTSIDASSRGGMSALSRKGTTFDVNKLTQAEFDEKWKKVIQNKKNQNLMKVKEQNAIDRKINASLYGIDFPIVHINANMYLIGTT
jgi:hypothetical protein